MACPFDLVMFDLDGTLVDTAPEITDSVNDTLQEFGLTCVQTDQVTAWIGHGTLTLLASAVAFVSGADVKEVRSSALFETLAADFALKYRKRCGTRSTLYPAVRETLEALRALGVKVAIVTNKESLYTEAVLDAHRLQSLLDLVICGDTFPTRKPDTAGVAHCLGKWDIPSQRAVFVGDSSIDVATARNANLTVWTVPYGYNMGQPIHLSNPDRVISDCSALLRS